MINGREYAWEDITVVVEGYSFPLDGVMDIKYGSAREFNELYGRGKDPHKMQPGKKSYKASIKVWQSVLEGLQRSLANRFDDITDLPPMLISIAYTPEDGGANTVDQLIGVRWSEFEKGMGTDDTHSEIEIELRLPKIKYNV